MSDYGNKNRDYLNGNMFETETYSNRGSKLVPKLDYIKDKDESGELNRASEIS